MGGCAVSPHQPTPSAPAIDVPATFTEPAPAASLADDFAPAEATPAQEPGAGAAPVSVEVKDFKAKTICEPIVATGTRMVVTKHCYTQDQNDKLAAERKASTRAKLEDLRRSEEMGERQDRQREMDRQRAAMSSAFP